VHVLTCSILCGKAHAPSVRLVSSESHSTVHLYYRFIPCGMDRGLIADFPWHHRRFPPQSSRPCTSFQMWDAIFFQSKCKGYLTSSVVKTKPISWSIGAENSPAGLSTTTVTNSRSDQGGGRVNRGLGAKRLGLEKRPMPRM
jgi:hypothetical protein